MNRNRHRNRNRNQIKLKVGDKVWVRNEINQQYPHDATILSLLDLDHDNERRGKGRRRGGGARAMVQYNTCLSKEFVAISRLSPIKMCHGRDGRPIRRSSLSLSLSSPPSCRRRRRYEGRKGDEHQNGDEADDQDEDERDIIENINDDKDDNNDSHGDIGGDDNCGDNSNGMGKKLKSKARSKVSSKSQSSSSVDLNTQQLKARIPIKRIAEVIDIHSFRKTRSKSTSSFSFNSNELGVESRSRLAAGRDRSDNNDDNHDRNINNNSCHGDEEQAQDNAVHLHVHEGDQVWIKNGAQTDRLHLASVIAIDRRRGQVRERNGKNKIKVRYSCGQEGVVDAQQVAEVLRVYDGRETRSMTARRIFDLDQQQQLLDSSKMNTETNTNNRGDQKRALSPKSLSLHCTSPNPSPNPSARSIIRTPKTKSYKSFSVLSNSSIKGCTTHPDHELQSQTEHGSLKRLKMNSNDNSSTRTNSKTKKRQSQPNFVFHDNFIKGWGSKVHSIDLTDLSTSSNDKIQKGDWSEEEEEKEVDGVDNPCSMEVVEHNNAGNNYSNCREGKRSNVDDDVNPAATPTALGVADNGSFDMEEQGTSTSAKITPATSLSLDKAVAEGDHQRTWERVSVYKPTPEKKSIHTTSTIHAINSNFHGDLKSSSDDESESLNDENSTTVMKFKFS